MSQEHHLKFPFTKDVVQKLKCGDIVYITGMIYTLRDMGHRRALDMIARGEELPVDLASGTIWHCAPIVRKNENDKWEVVSAGSTTSSRFTNLGSQMIKALNLPCTMGKGTMFKKAVDTMQEVGSCYLSTTGGCASLYAGQIEEVVDVYWTDLGLPEAIWALKVKDFGPLIVGIDCHGTSYYEVIGQKMRENLKKIYEKGRVDNNYNLSYLPRRVPCKASE